MAKKIQSLVEVLKQFDKPITPETLFEASGYSIDTIDEFYEKLKEEVDLLRTIEELRPDDANVFFKTGVLMRLDRLHISEFKNLKRRYSRFRRDISYHSSSRAEWLWQIKSHRSIGCDFFVILI